MPVNAPDATIVPEFDETEVALSVIDDREYNI